MSLATRARSCAHRSAVSGPPAVILCSSRRMYARSPETDAWSASRSAVTRSTSRRRKLHSRSFASREAFVLRLCEKTGGVRGEKGQRRAGKGGRGATTTGRNEGGRKRTERGTRLALDHLELRVRSFDVLGRVVGLLPKLEDLAARARLLLQRYPRDVEPGGPGMHRGGGLRRERGVRGDHGVRRQTTRTERAAAGRGFATARETKIRRRECDRKWRQGQVARVG